MLTSGRYDIVILVISLGIVRYSMRVIVGLWNRIIWVLLLVLFRIVLFWVGFLICLGFGFFICDIN